MKRIFFLFLTLAFFACDKSNDNARSVLVFSKTEGFRHGSIPDGIAALKKLGRENDFAVFATEDASKFNEDYLKNFSAVVFLCTTGDVLNNRQQSDFERYIQAGGGYVGIHAAADTEYEWPWYNKLVGGYFQSHPPGTPTASIDVVDGSHVSTKHLPNRFERTDEWYNYKQMNSDVNVLMNLDESTYEGGENGENHPIAWYHDYDGGRAFYTGGGHTSEAYSEPDFIQHVLGGIQWAIGKNERDYSKAVTYRVPPADRFVKTVLGYNFNEPMEIGVFPDGRVLLIERHGAIKVYYPDVNRVDSIAQLDVWTKYEDGGLGVAIDPNYEENNWVYIAYSPNIEKSVNYISRFTFGDRRWQPETEKVILEVPVQRDECCHAGGSLTFDRHGDLYFSIGDNTNPFASDGYSPIDERAGRTPWDAQRTSANTNDLRGGIIRITPQPDGSYTIPEGNLFPEGTPNTRPEIYVMGTRNPFRIHVDAKRDWLYWGDIGPDAGKDAEERGPRGIDELNVAKAPGFFGWPYFRGDGNGEDNVYHDYNFASQQSGPLFNPAAPINDSPNNTGMRELPPFQKPIVWYGYASDDRFPWIGAGGKNPMAGPVYYSDLVENPSETRLPEYFDGKLFFYEWMRDWVKVVHLDSMGNFVRADDFMPGAEFSHPMDMELGPDGSLYVLEYGQSWFSRNMDARLSRIDYVRGNRPPVPEIVASQTIGAAPLTVQFDASRTKDYDHDKVTYRWDFGTGSKRARSEATAPSFTFGRAGIYEVKLTATDAHGVSAEKTLQIQVGNDKPAVAWNVNGNRSFYWDDRAVDYAVAVNDREDATLGSGIEPERVQISIDYLPDGYDLTNIISGHQTGPTNAFAGGKKLIDQSDCSSCHAEDKKVNGPAYLSIADRYRGDANAVSFLAKKIITGGNGNWGETVMSAHPQLTEEQTTKMAKYIMSLGGGGSVVSAFPPEGKYVTIDHLESDKEGGYVLQATYADRGNGNVRSLSETATLVLRHPRIQAEHTKMKSPEAASTTLNRNNDSMGKFKNGGYLAFHEIDLTGINRIGIRLQGLADGSVSVHQGSPRGPEVGRVDFVKSETPEDYDIGLLAVDNERPQDLYFVFHGPRNMAMVDWMYFYPEQALTMR